MDSGIGISSNSGQEDVERGYKGVSRKEKHENDSFLPHLRINTHKYIA